jgi:SAM-dependent methyltransferase
MAHHHEHHDPDESTLAELLDLDAEVLGDHLAGVITSVAEMVGPTQPRRILDVGSGSGTGTFALLRHFPGSEVTALDVSESMLEHLRHKARELGLTDRVHPVRADLDADWPALEPFDLIWASQSLHHMADPDRALAEAYARLRPGGLLVVAETEGFPLFLTDEAGAALEARVHAVLKERRAHDMPAMGSDWGPRITKAGFTVGAARTFVTDLTPPLPPATGRYAQVSLQRLRTGLADRLSADDLAALDRLLDGGSLLTRDDLTVHSTRPVWIAQKN